MENFSFTISFVTLEVSPLYVWYALLLFIAAFNLKMLKRRMTDISAVGQYQTLMKGLAIPWVWECAWRSVFPSLYLQRFVFWDVPLNSILVDRTWAFIGELSWVYQTTLALRHIDQEISGTSTGTKWIQTSANLAFWIYVFAEGCSYYNTATTNELWAAIEVFFDGLSYFIMLPAALTLWSRCPDKGDVWSSARVYLAVMPLMCSLYPLYNFLIDCPMYMERYYEDEAAGKQYFDFLPGLQDAATTRNLTHDLADWQADMFWMLAYFSLGAWSGLLMMSAPRLASASDGVEAPTCCCCSGDSAVAEASVPLLQMSSSSTSLAGSNGCGHADHVHDLHYLRPAAVVHHQGDLHC